MDDPYEILNVARNATQDDIRLAYRNLAKKHHPDLNPGDAKAEERFKSISAANELLSNPEKRGQFDRGEIDAAGQEQASRRSYRDHAEKEAGRRYSGAAKQAPGWSEDDLRDMFGSMFNDNQYSRDDQRVRGEDENYVLTTAFLDAVIGATQQLTLPGGRNLSVKIPPGTTDGQTLRLRGQGGAGWNGGANGDALIKIVVAPHLFFFRKGPDILLDLPVTLTEAVIGGSIDVPTPTGVVRMNIPPGSDTGTKLRLRGKGVPKHGNIESGDLYATLRVQIGKPDAALNAFLRDWKSEHHSDPRHSMETKG